MYEELVTALQKRAVELPEKFSKNAENIDLFLKAADAIKSLNSQIANEYNVHKAIHRNLSARIPRWISAAERLPEKDIEVLVFAEGKIDGFLGDTAIAISKRYDFKIFTDYEGVEAWQSPWQYFLTDYEITHWMPLPEPPKEET